MLYKCDMFNWFYIRIKLMKNVFKKFDKDDFLNISSILDNKFSFTDDKKRNEIIFKMKKNPTKAAMKITEDHIRYFASSDMASVYRSLTSDETHVSIDEMIDDVSSKLKVRVDINKSLEVRFKSLVKQVIRKELLESKPEEIIKNLKNLNIQEKDFERVINAIKDYEYDIVTAMIDQLGFNVATKVITSIVQATLLSFIGENTAKVIATGLFKKNPYIQMLGPVVWTLTGAWIAIDLQGPAYRKTIPISLHIGSILISKEIVKREAKEKIEDQEINKKKEIKEEKEKDLEKELLRKEIDKLKKENEENDKFNVKFIDFNSGQSRNIIDVFPSVENYNALSLIIQEPFILSNLDRIEKLLKELVFLDAINKETVLYFKTKAVDADYWNKDAIEKDLYEKLRYMCVRQNLHFNSVKVYKNTEGHDRSFIFENNKSVVYNRPSNSIRAFFRQDIKFYTYETVAIK